MSRRKSVYRGTDSTMSLVNVFCSRDTISQHNGLNGEFLLYQVVLKRLLSGGLTDRPIANTLIEYFHPSDETDRSIMTEFDNTYKADKAIYWYTRESCIYRLLNKALRTQNIADLIVFTKFVRDLYDQLAYEQVTFLVTSPEKKIKVYRGQVISTDEINRMKYAKGQLISMNSFLSTSTNRKQALEFTTSRTRTDVLVPILFEIDLDLTNWSRPYADIKRLSAFAKEDEVLFMFGCVFRIDNICEDKRLKIWRAYLTLIANEDGDMEKLEEELEKQLEGKNVLVCLGGYLLQMQKFDEAGAHYEMILTNELISDEFDLASCYHGLAQVNEKKGEYDDAIKHLNIALKYLLKNPNTKDHHLVAQCYNDLGLIYTHLADDLSAFKYYELALKEDKNDVSVTYSGLSKLHFKMENYIIALEYQHRCLANQSKTAMSLVANTFMEIGKIHTAMKQFQKAIEMFEKAIRYQQKSLSLDHPDLGYTYIAMGLMYSDFNQEGKALECMQKAYDLQLKSLPNIHLDFAETFKNFGYLYKKKSDYDQALKYFNKLLENQLKTLSWKHPAVADSYLLIGNNYLAKKDYDNALIFLINFLIVNWKDL